MADVAYIEKSSWYKSVADAIRNKKGTTDPILRDDFASEISSITGGEEVPYYDGTVIIEKAESVLGLRRFIAEPNITDGIETVDSEIVYDVDFTIENLLYDAENNAYISGVGKQIAIEGVGTNEMLMATLSLVFSEVTMTAGEETQTATDIGLSFGLQGITTEDKSFQWASGGIPTINVISCEDETAKAWLLANTEGVSV